MGPHVTLLDRYRRANDAADAGITARFDELTEPDGTVRPGWSSVQRLVELGADEILRARSEVSRLLDDHGVTYTPSPSGSVSLVDDWDGRGAMSSPTSWRLDAVPLVIDAREWSALEAGLSQRARLYDLVLADLYGERRLLAEGLLPTAAIFDHDEYLRPLIGAGVSAMVLAGVDLGRAADGRWLALSDRTQAPSGMGYAMQNRRVLSRVLPDLFHESSLARLTPFFTNLRSALISAAPKQVEDPRVVVLSPGPHSETAYDQAFLASLLGFPLVEGTDLTVREGRVWMRVLDKLEEVDVILRRVDSAWCDPLELRSGSQLGATGLVECVRRGSVSIVNPLGSGILENPALLPFLPRLSETLLGEELLLPSVETWWCAEPAALSHVSAHISDLVIRSISRNGGRSVRAGALPAAQRERLLSQIVAAPNRFVAQELLDLSVAPAATSNGIVPRSVVLRTFTVADGEAYRPMVGGLASTSDPSAGQGGVLVTPSTSGASKDVWVVSREARPRGLGAGPDADLLRPRRVVAASAAMVPRVLDDLYWLGRYAERAEDLLRLILATSALAPDRHLDEATREAYPIARAAITHLSRTYPGFLGEEQPTGTELRSVVLDSDRVGTVAYSLLRLSGAAQGVRDQLSDDIWMVLARIERDRLDLAASGHRSWTAIQLGAERMLTGLLALSGIASENMVRDPGWYLLDSGRGLERALQVLRLIEVSVCTAHDPAVERLTIDTVLTASESIVTYRRRQRGLARVDSLVDLLVVDADNPRSVAYQLHRVREDLLRIPNSSLTVAPVRLLDDLVERVAAVDVADLAVVRDGTRLALVEFVGQLQRDLHEVSDEIHRQWQKLPPTPRLLTMQPLSELAPTGRLTPGDLR